MSFQIKSNIFAIQNVSLANNKETIVPGGRQLFDEVPKALVGIKQIGVIGWGSQGPAQAQNLRESLAGTGIKVKVGLRQGSSSIKKAEKVGFTKEDNSIGEMFEVITESDLVILLISDAAQVKQYKKIFQSLKSGATLGFSHGFLIGYLENINYQIRKDINIIAVCPKGMGPSVRRLYEQGKSVNGAGINSSIAVYQDADGKATEQALGWAIAIGSPFVFPTTMEMEYKSDIFGERGVLLGGVHGIVECLYRYFIAEGSTKEESFRRTSESITGPISKTISKQGLNAVYDSLTVADKEKFKEAYNASYIPLYDILMEIYEEVACGNEIRSVIMACERHEYLPMGSIDNTEMWKVGKKVRQERDQNKRIIDPVSAGVYVATIIAQVDVLAKKGHAYSEIVNESIIEAVDSLNPYLDYKGVSFMIDNCSTTARLGARKWASRFDYILSQQALPELNNLENKKNYFADFADHPVHQALAICAELRPSVDISLSD